MSVRERLLVASDIAASCAAFNARCLCSSRIRVVSASSASLMGRTSTAAGFVGAAGCFAEIVAAAPAIATTTAAAGAGATALAPTAAAGSSNALLSVWSR